MDRNCDLCRAPNDVTIWRLRGGCWSADGVWWYNKHGVKCDPPKVIQKDARVVKLRPLGDLQVCGWCYGIAMARRRSQRKLF